MKITPTQKELNEQSHIKGTVDIIERALEDLKDSCKELSEISCVRNMESSLNTLKGLKNIN